MIVLILFVNIHAQLTIWNFTFLSRGLLGLHFASYRRGSNLFDVSTFIRLIKPKTLANEIVEILQYLFVGNWLYFQAPFWFQNGQYLNLYSRLSVQMHQAHNNVVRWLEIFILWKIRTNSLRRTVSIAIH